MTEIRKSHQLYSVQEVIDIIQNGDSDFEFSSESDSSDDEEHGHPSAVEKEHEEPNNYHTDIPIQVETVNPRAHAPWQVSLVEKGFHQSLYWFGRRF